MSDEPYTIMRRTNGAGNASMIGEQWTVVATVLAHSPADAWQKAEIHVKGVYRCLREAMLVRETYVNR